MRGRRSPALFYGKGIMREETKWENKGNGSGEPCPEIEIVPRAEVMELVARALVEYGETLEELRDK